MLTFDELWEILITEDEGVEIEAKKGKDQPLTTSLTLSFYQQKNLTLYHLPKRHIYFRKRCEIFVKNS